MARLIKRTQNNYTNVSNQLVRDERLSWKARGIFIYLWSQADNWQFYVSEVAKHATDGRESLQNGLKELEKFGYLKRVNRQKNEDGHFAGLEWILSDEPSRPTGNTVNGENSKKSDKNAENPLDGKTARRETDPTGKPSLSNNNSKNYQREELTKERKQEGQAEPGTTLAQRRREVIDYLNKKTGKSFKPDARGNINAIEPRLKEGFTVDEMKLIINKKYHDWHGKTFRNGAKGDDYLKPDTLFRVNKIDGYLNEIKSTKKQYDDENFFGNSRQGNDDFSFF